MSVFSLTLSYITITFHYDILHIFCEWSAVTKTSIMFGFLKT